MLRNWGPAGLPPRVTALGIPWPEEFSKRKGPLALSDDSATWSRFVALSPRTTRPAVEANCRLVPSPASTASSTVTFAQDTAESGKVKVERDRLESDTFVV